MTDLLAPPVYTPTPAEQAAYTHMQARLVSLLLRYNEPSFRQRYGLQPMYEADALPEPLRRYRELAVLFYLSDALFDDILPRIVRRLSFESPRQIMIEEPPARGRINWERTLDATWAERSGDAPLQLHTRQRRRDFATPENLLAVATLLDLHADAERLLWDERLSVGADALRHPLNEIVERCERELAFPQFAGLRKEAQRMLDADADLLALEAEVAANLLPGSNSAYDDLLLWRAQRRSLSLLRRQPADQSPDTLGADPERDNYLYQLWIFFELAELLHMRGLLNAIDERQGGMALRFRWGDAGAICRYELRHDQGVPDPVARWHAAPDNRDVPGVRPDFYMRRLEPASAEVRDGDALIWREPGVVWDAKYYRERASTRTPAGPVKRMLADLALLGEEYGVLLFAFLGHASGMDELDAALLPGQRLMPTPGHDQTLTPRMVAAHELRPNGEAAPGDVHARLTHLLDDAHACMAQPRVPACHGIFLDALSADAHAGLTSRYGAALGGSMSDWLVCPKPHIGPWRVDLVSRAQHCCRDARLCHIVGMPGAQPPVHPARSAEELLEELQRIFANSAGDEPDDEAIAMIARQVEAVSRQFARYAGLEQRIAMYEQRLYDLGLERRAAERLGAHERESLALAIFLVEQLDNIGAHDYSAPAIHLSSVMELEVQRRVFACPTLVGDIANPKKQTLGVLPWMQRSSEHTEGNWERIVAFVTPRWNAHVQPDEPEQAVTFDMLIAKALNPISQLRNRAAHPHVLSRNEYAQLQKLMFQGGKLGYGALNVLVLVWHGGQDTA